MKTRIIYGLLSALFMWLYWLTWQGAALFLFIFVAFLFTYLVYRCFKYRNTSRREIASIVVVGILVGLVFYYRIAPLIFAGITAQTTMELAPLTPISAWINFGSIMLVAPVALAFLIWQAAKRGEATLILLAVWSAVMMVITTQYLRAAYYFAINAVLLSSWFICYIWHRFNKDLPKAIAITALLLGLVVFPNIQGATARYGYYTPPDSWCEALTWVEGNTPEDSVILAWWDCGYWILRIGKRTPYAGGGIPSDKVEETAKMLLSPPSDDLIDADYLILDSVTMTNKLFSITTWASMDYYFNEYESSLMYKLYNDEPVEQYELVFASEQEFNGISEVKVFKRRIIDE